MRLYKYLFFLGMLVLAACQSEEAVPADVLSEDRMPFIVADVHIVDGDLYNVSQMPDSLYKYSMGHYTAVFKKYHTDSAQFRKSYTWYTKHPVKLDAIYDNVLKILQKKVDSVAKLPNPPPPKPITPAPNTTTPSKPNAVPAQ